MILASLKRASADVDNCGMGTCIPHKVHEGLDVKCGSPSDRDPEEALASALPIARFDLQGHPEGLATKTRPASPSLCQ